MHKLHLFGVIYHCLKSQAHTRMKQKKVVYFLEWRTSAGLFFIRYFAAAAAAAATVLMVAAATQVSRSLNSFTGYIIRTGIEYSRPCGMCKAGPKLNLRVTSSRQGNCWPKLDYSGHCNVNDMAVVCVPAARHTHKPGKKSTEKYHKQEFHKLHLVCGSWARVAHLIK